MKRPLMGSSVDWTQLRKESVKWKLYLQKLPNLKCKEKKNEKRS